MLYLKDTDKYQGIKGLLSKTFSLVKEIRISEKKFFRLIKGIEINTNNGKMPQKCETRKRIF